jgi:pimeloyl-ACP methyl ester carboxylesterase
MAEVPGWGNRLERPPTNMRILEVVFVAIEFFVLVASLATIGACGAWMKALECLVVVLGVVMVWADVYRWQMYPACLVAAVFAWYLAAHLTNGSVRAKRFPVLLSLASMLLLISAVVLGSVLPVFSLPTPEGPFAIGTTTHIWFRPVASRDIARGWVESRKIIVQLWYPTAAGQEGKIAQYRDLDSGRPLMRYLSLVRTHARIGVPISPAQPTYPVLMFSPAWGGGRTDYTAFYEMLSSHGFVVAAMEHMKDLDGPFLGMNLEQYREAGALVRRRAEDAAYVLDQLTKRNESDPDKLLTGHLDLSRVGILGHSFGGATAAEACWLDSRFKSGIDVDGDLFGEVADAGVSQPFFFMSSYGQPPSDAELHAADPGVRFTNEMEALDWNRKESWLVHRGGYELMIRGTLHLNYSDRPLFSPVKRLTGAGEIAPRRALQIADAYILAFFDRTLNGQPESLLNGATERFPEAIFKEYPAPVSQ